MQNKILKILLSIILLLIGGISGYLLLTQEIPISNSLTQQGTVITANMISTTRILKNSVTDDIVTEPLYLVGKELVVDMPSNTAFKYSYIQTPVTTNEGIEEQEISITGTTVLPITVKNDKVPSDLKKGDTVRILVFMPASGSKSSFIYNIDTIATVNAITYSDDNATVISKVDLVIDENKATELIVASSAGQVYLLKNNGSTGSLSTKSLADIYNNYSNSSTPTNSPEESE